MGITSVLQAANKVTSIEQKKKADFKTKATTLKSAPKILSRCVQTHRLPILQARESSAN